MSLGIFIHNLKIGASHTVDTILSGIFGHGTAVSIEDSFTAGVHDLVRKLPSAMFSIAETGVAAALSSIGAGGGVSGILAAAVPAIIKEAEGQGIKLETEGLDALHTATRLMALGQIAALPAPAKAA